MTTTPWKTHPAIRRYPGNPVLTKADLPYEADLVFNAGCIKHDGRYVLMFRNDYGRHLGPGHVEKRALGIAFSDDGYHWTAQPHPVDVELNPFFRNAYDPRLVEVDGTVYTCFCMYEQGTRGAIAVTDDFHRWELISTTQPGNRNLVLFPEKIGGMFYRLERPMEYLFGPEHFDLWISASPDARYWGDYQRLLSVDDVPWANMKIGPSTPPLRTEKGWLVLFHAVDIDEERHWGRWKEWCQRYTVGVMLLDLDDPTKILGLTREPVFVPEDQYAYESGGYRPYVLFPCGLIMEPDRSVKIYYGAADNYIALATSTVDELLGLVCAR